MSIVHVANNPIDKHEVLIKSIQAVAAEWNLLDAKGHATARKGGEMLEKYEDIYGHRKYTEMVENEQFGVSKSTCQKWKCAWEKRDDIKKKCDELGLGYETIGLTKALKLIGKPRPKPDDDGDEDEQQETDPGDGDKKEQEAEQVEAEREQVDTEKVSTPGIEFLRPLLILKNGLPSHRPIPNAKQRRVTILCPSWPTMLW